MLARAEGFASGATASSRSKISTSAARLRALSSARVLDAGMNSAERRGRTEADIEAVPTAASARHDARHECLTTDAHGCTLIRLQLLPYWHHNRVLIRAHLWLNLLSCLALNTVRP